MALEAHALVTFAELQELMPTADTSRQTYAETLINMSSAVAEQYAKRKLAARDYSGERHSGDGRSMLMLREYPIVSVSAVYIDSTRTFAAESEVSDYEIDAEVGGLWRAEKWPAGHRNVSVDYRAGFESVPDDLRLAVVETVIFNWQRLQSQNIGARSARGLDGIETEFELTVPVNAQRTFEAYRRPDVW